MQDRALITTPLFEPGSQPPVDLVQGKPPGRLRLLRIGWFVFASVGLWWRSRISILFGSDLYRESGARNDIRRIRDFLEEMGGMWVKAGQFIAMRRDLFLPETCDELAKLQDHAVGFPFADVRRMVESELGAPLESLFSEFSAQPLAAASIGQTHAARLRGSGARVAVKVQRPYIQQAFEGDLRYLRFVTTLFRRFGIAPQGRWGEMLWELERTLSEELDYRVEAASIHAMRKNLRQHKVYAPKVYFEYSTRRVLTMEFLEGAFMSDYIKMVGKDPARLERWLSENNIAPKKLGQRLLLSHLRQLFEDNRYHCDLHPGNILLMRDSRFALIDFGSVGHFDQGLLRRHRMMNSALADGDFTKAADVFLTLGPPLPNKDLSNLKAEIVRALRVWETRTGIRSLAYHEKSISAVFNMFAKLMQQEGVSAAWDFLRLNRAQLTLDASLMFLTPDLDYIKLIRKYERRARARALVRAGTTESRVRALTQVMSLAELPEQLAENFFFQGKWLRQRAINFEAKIGKFAYVAREVLSLLSYASLAAATLVVGHYLRRYHGIQVEALRLPWLTQYLEGYRMLAPETFIVIIIATVFFARRLNRIRQFVQEKEFDHPGHSR